jgi:MYXO-CTERM domain-containing protein
MPAKDNPFDRRAVSRAAAMRTLTVLLGAAVLLASGAAAHGPPAKRDQDFRLLADHNDDCGGDDGGALSECGGAHDLVGLDVRETHDAALGDVVAFRFILNGGSGTLKDVLTLKAGSSTKTFELRTSDNQAFDDTGFDSVTVGPALNGDGSQDGDRFVVEATVKLATLGGAGVLLDDYVVESYRGSTRGDVMPGCYYNALGSKVSSCSPGDDQTQFERVNGYALQGPTYYAKAATPQAEVAAGSSTEVEVEVTNLLRSTAQTATVQVSSPPSVTAVWKDGRTDATTLDLPKGGTAKATLRVEADAGAQGGDIVLTLTTNLGGRSVHSVPVKVGASQGTETAPTAGDEDAPTPAAATVAFLLLAFAAVRRR